jgi:LTR polyprotein gag-polypeptide-like protein/zinc knuckle protein
MSSDRYLTSITKLNGENYHDWKFAVSMALRQKGCWGVVSGKEEKSSTREGEKAWDQKAEEGLTVIALTVEASQYTYIRNSTNGIEAWNALKEIYEKNSRATRISLKRQFYGFVHDTNAPISAYVNGISDLAGKLKAIGIALTDEEVTDVLIFNLDNEYSSIAASLTSTKGELKISEVTSALIEEEQRRGGGPTVDSAISLYSNSGHGPPGRRGPHRDRREGLSDNRKCFRCGRTGHISHDCHARKTFDGKDITSEMEKEAREKSKEISSMAYQINSSLNDIAY